MLQKILSRTVYHMHQAINLAACLGVVVRAGHTLRVFYVARISVFRVGVKYIFPIGGIGTAYMGQKSDMGARCRKVSRFKK